MHLTNLLNELTYRYGKNSNVSILNLHEALDEALVVSCVHLCVCLPTNLHFI